MWLKLAGLVMLTIFAIFLVIPIRTHAVKYDVVAGGMPPPPQVMPDRFSDMYLTPGTILLIAAILAVAGFAAWRIARGQW